MIELAVYNRQGEVVGHVEVDETLFGSEVRSRLLHQATLMYEAARRAGTASTRTRGQVAGSNAKPWRQKGTGRARVGSTRTPLWRGGGAVHGPRPRSYDYRLPRKVRLGALRAILSQRLACGRLRVVDELTPGSHKTRAFLDAATKLGLANAVFVDRRDNADLQRATGNVRTMHVLDHFALNPYDLLRFRNIVFSRAAVQSVSEALKP